MIRIQAGGGELNNAYLELLNKLTIQLSLSNREVRLYKIGELCDITRGKVYSKPYIKENPGIFPVYSSQTLNDGVLGKISTYDFDGEYVTWTTDGYAGTVFYRNGKFSVTNVCGILKIKDTSVLNVKYLSYVAKIVFPKLVNKSSINSKLMSNVVENIKIPVPSLSIQNKIVTILDQLETYSKDITTGLPLEINLRKKQYESYQSLLLDFDKNSSGGGLLNNKYLSLIDDLLFKLSKDEITIENGKSNHIKNNFTVQKLYQLVYFDRRFKGIDKNKQKTIFPFKHIKNEKLKQYPIDTNGTVRLLSSGQFDGYTTYIDSDKNINYGEVVSIPTGGRAYLKYHKGYFIDSNNILMTLIDPSTINLKFLYYYLLNRIDIISECYRGASVKHPDMSLVLELDIIVPPITVQKQIVSILDKFNNFVNDLKNGLPKLIDFSKLQYSYYLNKIFDFKC